MPFAQVPPDVSLAGFDFASASVPCFGETANGDALFVETGRVDGATLLVLLDVMGHGDSTTETMGTLLDALRDSYYENHPPAELLSRLQTVLASYWDARLRFAAAVAVLIEATGQQLTGANAAQPEPRLGRPGASWAEWSLPAGAPLGIPDLGDVYAEATTTLAAGDWLVLSTDGVTEAGAYSGFPQFQHSHLPGFFAGLATSANPASVVAALLSALQSHVGANWPEDDTTFVCLRRL